MLNTPVVQMAHASSEHFSTVLDNAGKQVLEDIQDAIAVATADLALLPGAAFQARVLQLAQLNCIHQTVSDCHLCDICLQTSVSLCMLCSWL